MLTVKDCAELNLGIYGMLSAPVTWDHFDDGSADDGVCWGVKFVDDSTPVFVFRGSDNLPDGLKDMMALTKPWGAPGLGPVHPGFYLGMRQAWDEAKLNLKASDRAVLTGHSLGAARSKIFAGEMALGGFKPTSLVRFGSPRPGFQQLSDLVNSTGLTQFNHQDVDAAGDVDDVTCTPWNIPIERYTDDAFTKLLVVPTGSDLDLFRLHHMQLYYGAAPLTPVL